MAVPYYGDFAEDDTVNLPFNTFSSNDPSASVTATELIASDIFVHKDGSATSITTDGATIDIDAPGVGAHMITIDTSVHADYATGSEYAVRVNGMTVDGGLINAWVGAFSIERAGGVLAITKLIQAAVITNAAGDDVAADIIALKAETVLILADTDDIGVAGAGLTDLGGMSTGMKGEVNTEADSAIVTYKLDHLVFVAESDDPVDNSIIAKMVNSGATADWSAFVNTTDSLMAIRDHATTIKDETALIVADTNELQVDWVNAGRLDTIIDAIKAKTDSLTFTIANEVDANTVTIGTGVMSADAAATDMVNEIRDAIYQGTLTEGYAGLADSPTLEQILYMIYSVYAQNKVVTTAITTFKIDGTTTAMIFTTDDDTNPTLRDRTT